MPEGVDTEVCFLTSLRRRISSPGGHCTYLVRAHLSWAGKNNSFLFHGPVVKYTLPWRMPTTPPMEMPTVGRHPPRGCSSASAVIARLPSFICFFSNKLLRST